MRPDWFPTFGRADSGDAYTYRCPVIDCRYRFPPDLYDAARAQHAPAHPPEQWEGFLDGIADQEAVIEREHSELLDAIQVDREQVEKWRDAARAAATGVAS